MLFKNIWKYFVIFFVVGLFSTNNSIDGVGKICHTQYTAQHPENVGNYIDQPFLLREFSVRVLNWATEYEKNNLSLVLERGLNQEEFWYHLDYFYNCNGIYSVWLFQQLEYLLDLSTEDSVLYNNLLSICGELKMFIRRRYPRVAHTYFDIHYTDQLILKVFTGCVLNWATENEKNDILTVLERGLNQEELWYCLDSVYNCKGIYSVWLFQQMKCLLVLSTENSILYSNLLPICDELESFITRRYPDVSNFYFEQNYSIEDVLYGHLNN